MNEQAAMAGEARPLTYMGLVDLCRARVAEIFPWDLAEEIEAGREPLILDVREPYEFQALHIAGSLNVPRGVLEPACDWGYEETVPAIARAREGDIVVVCRSGYRSIFAADTLQRMGYRSVRSLKTGLRGWNDYEQPLVDANEQPVDVEEGDDYFTTKLRPEQMRPEAR